MGLPMRALMLLILLSAAPSIAVELPLLDLDGGPAGTVADFRGEAVVMNFWASWCKPCQLELPALQKIAGERKGQKVRVITVNLDTTAAAARKFIDKRKLSLPVYRLAPEVLRALNLQSVPVNIIFAPDGKVAATWSGYSTDFERNLNALLDSFQGR